MAESECGRREFGINRWVDVRVVLGISFRLDVQIELVHSFWTNHQRHELVVSYHLHLSANYSPRNDKLSCRTTKSNELERTWSPETASRRPIVDWSASVPEPSSCAVDERWCACWRGRASNWLWNRRIRSRRSAAVWSTGQFAYRDLAVAAHYGTFASGRFRRTVSAHSCGSAASRRCWTRQWTRSTGSAAFGAIGYRSGKAMNAQSSGSLFRTEYRNCRSATTEWARSDLVEIDPGRCSSRSGCRSVF